MGSATDDHLGPLDLKPGIAKVHESGEGCRICGKLPVEAAHLVHRSRGAKGFDDPDLVVPLCRGHHQKLDAHTLELLPYLTYDEQAAVVKLIGIERAMRRLTYAGSRPIV